MREGHVPLERQMTWTVLFSSGFVKASSVGEKNIASSSGCAISSVIRWFRNGVIRAEERVYSLQSHWLAIDYPLLSISPWLGVCTRRQLELGEQRLPLTSAWWRTSERLCYEFVCLKETVRKLLEVI